MTTATSAPALLGRVLGAGEGLEARARARGERLARLARDDVLAPAEIDCDAHGLVTARVPVVDGVDLAQLAVHRAPLSAGECVWLGRRIAAALAAMHAAGLVHGDVAPANVLVRRDGVTLVDTLGAARADERGTPGFRAPETVAGEHGEAADVFALGRLLRWAVNDADEDTVRAWTVPLVAADPAARPSAAAVDAVLALCAPERSVAPSPPDIVSSVRQRAMDRTERLASGRAWRAWRWGLRAVAVAAATLTVAWGALSVPGLLDSAEGEDGTGDPATAARDLTEARIGALAAGDPDALLATVTGDGTVAKDASTAAEELASGTSYEGLGVEVQDVAVLSEDEDSARVAVTYVVSEHTVVSQGEGTVVPATRQAVDLTLTATSDGWRVAAAVATEAS
ncbi:RIO1 family regulatory kinase/ATPase [Demequina sp. NBRC 110057]|uniref:protein kinase domain-containing protein n=1 Tax=Demequina sp. NBRC 110057 TaxID=1570346 RepID=UPI000A0074B9|nr:RIO1 family regulatory kinase/ATPase [Demequina sp. NBRC 110057]